MTKSKLEKVLEYMVNDESDLARDLLHEHIVESAREIYADLAEDDDLAEEDLELDEDLDESFYDDDESDDFEDDISTMEDELESEEYFGEDDDEDEAMDDLSDEMGDEMGDDMDMDMDMDDDMEGGETDAEEAMVNVEDAIDELKAVFADLMGDDDMGDDDMGDEVADEFSDMDDDMDDDTDDEDLDEDAKMHKHSVTMSGDDDSKASPVLQNAKDMSDGHAKAVNFAGGDEKGGAGDSAKKMSVTGPQEQKGKMDKKVSAPSNKSEKTKSNIGS